MSMHKGFDITSAVAASAMLGLALAGWLAGRGDTRDLLGGLAVVSGLGLGLVWIATTATLDLSGRDEWLLTCATCSAFGLAFGLFKTGPTPAALLWSLAAGPVGATLGSSG